MKETKVSFQDALSTNYDTGMTVPICFESLFSLVQWDPFSPVQRQVKWGCDLQSQHEYCITEEAINGCAIAIMKIVYLS
ncbi:hypothetical protein Tco_1284238 [Tanacetum coccineum]